MIRMNPYCTLHNYVIKINWIAKAHTEKPRGKTMLCNAVWIACIHLSPSTEHGLWNSSQTLAAPHISPRTRRCCSSRTRIQPFRLGVAWTHANPFSLPAHYLLTNHFWSFAMFSWVIHRMISRSALTGCWFSEHSQLLSQRRILPGCPLWGGAHQYCQQWAPQLHRLSVHSMPWVRSNILWRSKKLYSKEFKKGCDQLTMN